MSTTRTRRRRGDATRPRVDDVEQALRPPHDVADGEALHREVDVVRERLELATAAA